MLKGRAGKISVTYPRQSFLRNLYDFYFANSSRINSIIALLVGIILFCYYSHTVASLAGYRDVEQQIGKINTFLISLFIKLMLLFEFVFIPFVTLEMLSIGIGRGRRLWRRYFSRYRDLGK